LLRGVTPAGRIKDGDNLSRVFFSQSARLSSMALTITGEIACSPRSCPNTSLRGMIGLGKPDLSGDSARAGDDESKSTTSALSAFDAAFFGDGE
jgi:hypothetical protein